MVAFQPFIYGLVDPADPGHVRYVGMAPVRACRPHEHAKEARKKSTHTSHRVNWIRKIQAEGREPSVMVLEQLSDGADQKFLGFVEQCYIKSLREIGHRLTNVSDGGWGGETGKKGKPGLPHSEETRAKISAANTGHGFSEETLAKIRAARKGKGHPHTPESRARIGAASRLYRATEETRERMRVAQKGKHVSLETRAKTSAALTGTTWSEEKREHMRVAVARRKAEGGYHLSDEARVRMSVSAKAKVVTPETRAKQREGIRAFYAKRRSERDAIEIASSLFPDPPDKVS